MALSLRGTSARPFPTLWPNPLVDNASAVAVPEPSLIGFAGLALWALPWLWQKRLS
ncbi:hypothetical protein SBV1_1300006 [Verrucomicrobia bacterium]|nr:hypothetical protein SBV1_1300006 [Verrucomicrobiota bacterium]